MAFEPDLTPYLPVKLAESKDPPEDPSDEEDLGELQVAEYLVFLLSLETYLRWLEEKDQHDTSGESHNPHDDADGVELDAVGKKGMRLLLRIETQMAEAVTKFVVEQLPSESQKRMFARGMGRSIRTPSGVVYRAYQVQQCLERGGAATLRAVFDTNRAIRLVKNVMVLSDNESATVAFPEFASYPMSHALIRGWLDDAADWIKKQTPEGTAPLKVKPRAVDQAVAETSGVSAKLLATQAVQLGARGTEVLEAGNARQDQLNAIESKATEAAKRAMDAAGEEDRPLTRSEVIGVATAAALATSTDPQDTTNIPASLREALGKDAEQLAAALTDGRVVVAAGAGSGKSRTAVARVAYLVKDRGVAPSRIILTSFGAKAAADLRQKVSKELSQDQMAQMKGRIATIHSIAGSIVRSKGTPRQVARVGIPGKSMSGAQIQSAASRAVQSIWRKEHPIYDADTGTFKDGPAPSLKGVGAIRSVWKGNGVTPQQARMEASTGEEATAAEWYELYEGLKGNIPGWSPSLKSDAAKAVYTQFMARYRPDGLPVGDFDDHLEACLELLETNPQARKQLQAGIDHIIVDECQDLNQTQVKIFERLAEHIQDGDGRSFWQVGDQKQCVEEHTPISTPDGEVMAKDLVEGTAVLAYRNGKVVQQVVTKVWPSDWDRGVKVTTYSGRVLTMSPNHRIWATAPVIGGDQTVVYLMYRKDMGYRVGITNKGQDTDNWHDTFGSRLTSERARLLWVLDIAPTRADALFLETSYSLTYGIPTGCFVGHNRGLDQDRLDRVFRAFGHRGEALLKAKDLDFNYPHYVACSSGKIKDRKVLSLLAHSSKGSQVVLEWQDSPALDKALQGHYTTNAAGSRRVRPFRLDYREAEEYAAVIAAASGAFIRSRLVFQKERIPLLTASGLHPGMKVLVRSGDGLALDPIVSVEKVEGLRFLDLEVTDAANFFGGGILSHNCIYSFRGAKPELFEEKQNNPNWKNRQITTNYRCPPAVVGFANQMIANNAGDADFVAKPRPGRAADDGSVVMLETPDEAGSARVVINAVQARVQESIEQTGAPGYGDHAVLARTNRELDYYETALILRGIPYARKGAKATFGTPEMKGVLGALQVVQDQNPKSSQEALVQVMGSPFKGFKADPSRMGRDKDYGIGASLRKWANQMGLQASKVTASAAMADPGFRRILAQEQAGGKQFGKGFEEKLRFIEMMAEDLQELGQVAADPGASMQDVMSTILAFRAADAVPDPRNPQYSIMEPVSYRDALLKANQDKETDEAEEPSSTPGEVVAETDVTKLGGLSFIYDLMTPNPDDPNDAANDPRTLGGFTDKIARIKEKAAELSIDITAFEKDLQDRGVPLDQWPKPPGVYLGTIHATKGAQWESTYVLMPEGTFPMRLRIPPEITEDHPDYPRWVEKAAKQLEDERRLGYVAVTRTERNMHVLCPKQNNNKPAGISQFVYEMGLRKGENIGAPQEAEAITDEVGAEGVPVVDTSEGTTIKTADWEEEY